MTTNDSRAAHENVTSVSMPSGTYWAGDPCYSMPPGEWDRWLAAAVPDPKYWPSVLVADVLGHTVVGVGTTFGDWTYRANDGTLYPVDSGMIGLVPVELCAEHAGGTHLVTFDEPFVVERTPTGVICIGHLRIPTDI